MLKNILDRLGLAMRAIAGALALAGISVAADTGRAVAGETLTVYTYDSFTAEWGPGPAIEKAFEKECGCDLRFVSLGDGVAILNRLRMEGARTKADVILGLDTNLVSEARATGLLAPHGISLKPLKVPVKWSDEVFVPYDWAHFAVVYDSERVKNPPRSLKALVEGPEDVKIVIQDPRTSTPGLGLLLWMKAVYGEKAADAWKRLKRRVLTVTPGWSAAYGLFTKGEVPMVFSYITSPAYHMIEEKTTRYRAAIFSEGHYLQIEVAAAVKGGNLKLARRFLAFMLTPGFQDHIPTRNWMFPAGETSRPLPEAFSRLGQPPRTLLFDPDTVARNRKAWIDEWLAAMSE